MPFEVGMTIAQAVSLNRSHQWIVLEEMPHRLEKSLSDLNGYDAFVHHGTVTGLLQTLFDAFENADLLVSMAYMKDLYKRLRRVAQQAKVENGWPDLYRAAAFRQLTLAARNLMNSAANQG